MTVFKGFLTITKRNMGMIFLYIAIFLTISFSVQAMLGDEGAVSFERESLNIAVIDRDGSELAEGLTSYLGGYHTLKDLPDDKSILQDRLFYREVNYIVTIPENFEEKCLAEGEKLSVTKVPGSTSGYYVDQQINTFLNDVRILTKGGFSLSDAVAEVQKNTEITPEVTLIDKNGHGGELPGHAFMFQYMPYILLSILCYTLGYIMIAFSKPEVRKRTLCSSMSARSMSLQLLLGYVTIGALVWILCTMMPVIVYGKEFLTDAHLPYYLMNSFLMMLVSLSLSFLISAFLKNEDLISAIVNVLTLGMAFTCGVFVSMDVLGKGVKTVARFLPVYWYEVANELIGGNAVFSEAQLQTLYQCFGIQLLFAAAFVGITLVFRRQRKM